PSKDLIAERYLLLLKKSLLDELYLENEARILFFVQNTLTPLPSLDAISSFFLNIRNQTVFSSLKELRKTGAWIRIQHTNSQGESIEPPHCRGFSFTAHTMIGRARVDNIHDCLNTIVEDDIPGDLIETGVWKGGATIFMRGFLAAHRIRNRKVWVADSFEGLPAPTHQKDHGCDFSKEVFPYLSVGLEEVRELFERYDLLDDQVRFLKGWFCDTLPSAPIKKLALLRLDGDLYESTMDALENLYSKLSPGGFVIVDDYYAFPQCKLAVDEFRDRHGIRKKIIQIDHDSMYWRKPR
ncbi:MAG: class I SAM-dependent methyltransferase, partial [Sulfuricella sp.]|nr:class I SAM-dependent methyltransferase [Sulfuricella sp.]